MEGPMANGSSFGNTVKKVVGWIMTIFFGYMAFISAIIPFLALLEGETEDFLMLIVTCVVMFAVNAGLCYLGINLAASAKANEMGTPSPKSAGYCGTAVANRSQPAPTAAAPASATPPARSAEEPVKAAYPELMTGQLVARFKQTHDQAYHDEYRRRLMFVGLEEPEAESLFMLELMILKHDSIEPLASDDYLKSNYFDLQHVLLPQDKEYYIEHQRFLVSEIVKIWDEAEWHYWNSHERELPDEVWAEIHAISRYGGGKLFVEYLQMIAEKSHVPMEQVQKYSMAEQNMIFKYKWNAKANEKHPYEKR